MTTGRWIFSLVLCCVAACGDSDSGSGSELACPQSAPCVQAELGATANDGGSSYLDSVVCVLEALRDRTAGDSFQLEAGVGLDGDAPVRENFVVRSDGSVVRQSTSGGTQGTPTERSDIEVCTLRDAQYFSDCLDTPSLDCLDTDQWFSACAVDNGAACDS